MTNGRLNMNQIPYVSWKGKTLSQVTSVFQKNKKTFEDSTQTLSVHDIRKARPLRIYRKEIANIVTPSCSRRSSTIAAFEQPGGSIVNSNSNLTQGLANTLDIATTTLRSEHPGQCATPSCDFLSPELNAKRRVRSGGMYPKKFKPDYNNDKAYFTSTPEYLVARNRTIQQNSYVFFKQGNSGVQPGTGNAKSNVYAPSGLSHCYQPMISVENDNNTFTYTWVDNSVYTVTIPDGQYDTEGLNEYFKKVMIQNGHYFILNSTGAKVFLLTIDYDNFNNLVKLEANPATKNYPYPISGYTPASGTGIGTWYYELSTGSPDTPPNLNEGDKGFTSIIVSLENNFGLLIGFEPGNYYWGGHLSSFKPLIAPNYVPLYFKPSNVTFGMQGPVDSSTYTHRVKVNEVTRNGYLSKSGYGTATANAMAYGVSEQPYTVKDRIGFTNINTPIVNSDGSVCCKNKFIYRMK